MDDIEALMAMRVEKVRELLVHLDRPTILRIFDRLGERPPRDGGLADQVTAVILELLKGDRRQYARRLWTSWLEPVLVRDRLVPASGRPLPGTVHAVDAGAWWAVLAPRMGGLATDIQERIEDLVRRMPLDRVLESEQARRWAELLRHRSVAELRAVRSDPAALAELLAAANAERARVANAVRRLDRQDLDTLLNVLEAMSAWADSRRRPRPEEDLLLVAVRQALVESGMTELNLGRT